MADSPPPKDLFDWMGLSDVPNWRVARPLGKLFALVLFLLFVLSLAAAIVLLGTTVTTPGTGNLGTGALIVALLGAPFLIWNTLIRHRALGFQKEGHLTDRISKAVEQLGAEKTVKTAGPEDQTVERTVANIEVRIGGLLSLERIAQDSTVYDKGRDQVLVMEILCTYVRANAPASSAKDHEFDDWEPLQDDPTEEQRAAHQERRAERFGEQLFDAKVRKWAQALPPPRQDIALALTIIGRRNALQRRAEARWGKDARPDADWVFDTPCPTLPERDDDTPLSTADLDAYRNRLKDWKAGIASYAGYRPDLGNTNLQGAKLAEAILSGAILTKARMEGAILFLARMEGAFLRGARMEGAVLTRARMEGADLTLARMDHSTVLSAATLGGAALQEVDLSSVPIAADQVTSCFGDASTLLPDGVKPGDPGWPPHWPVWALDWGDFDTEWRKWQVQGQAYRPPLPPDPGS